MLSAEAAVQRVVAQSITDRCSVTAMAEVQPFRMGDRSSAIHARGGVIDAGPGRSVDSVVVRLEDWECVIGPDLVCRRTDARHRAAGPVEGSGRFWECPCATATVAQEQ